MKVKTAKKLVKIWNVTKIVTLCVVGVTLLFTLLTLIVLCFIKNPLPSSIFFGFFVFLFICSMIAEWWRNVEKLADSEPDQPIEKNEKTN